MTDRPLVQIVNVSVVGQFENADVALQQSAVSAKRSLVQHAAKSNSSPLQKCQNFAACAGSRDFSEAAKDFMLPGSGNGSRSCNAQQV